MPTQRHPFAAPAAPDPTRQVSPMGWMDRATCASVDPLVWHAEGSGGDTPVFAEKARAICRWCPVAAECWNYAQATDTLEGGIWAGLTHRDRREAYRAMAVGA
jgi:WhiB family transcriptional regulator, redox-sensing transcriptional regulator